MNLKHIKGEIQKSQKGIYEAVASTPNQDRDGESISSKGWDLEEYQKNPVLLFGHNHQEPPVGRVLDIAVKSGQLLCKFAFATTERAKELKKLVDEKVLNALSVGFMPVEKEEDKFTEAKLLEISLVSVPSNPEALIMARSKGLNTKILKELDIDDLTNEEKLLIKISKNFDKRLAVLEKAMEKPQPKLKEKGQAKVGKEQVSKPDDKLVLERTLQILAKYSNTSLGEIKKLKKD